MKDILSAFAACVMAILLIYVVHELVHIGTTGSDRDVVVALEFVAVVVLIATVLGEEVMHFFISIFRLIRGKKLEGRSKTGSLVTVYVTVVSSLFIYFAFVKYVIPL
jgi:hypothetical protein